MNEMRKKENKQNILNLWFYKDSCLVVTKIDNNLKEKGFSKNLALTQANLQYTV